MESRKIQRLEFVSHKIEGGDSKSEVICIRFAHPTTKMSLFETLHGRRPWPDLKLHGAPERGSRKGRRRGAVGHGWGGGAWPGLEGCCS
jgi:hypothetical protein